MTKGSKLDSIVAKKEKHETLEIKSMEKVETESSLNNKTAFSSPTFLARPLFLVLFNGPVNGSCVRGTLKIVRIFVRKIGQMELMAEKMITFYI